MIIDVILDRKDGIKYDNKMAQAFVVYGLSNHNHNIVSAFVYNDEQAIQNALCEYIDADSTYNPEIKKYIRSQVWKLPKTECLSRIQFANLLDEHNKDEEEILYAANGRAEKIKHSR